MRLQYWGVRRGSLKAELGEAADMETKLRELEALAGRVDEYLADLPGLLDRHAVVREYETVPAPSALRKTRTDCISSPRTASATSPRRR